MKPPIRSAAVLAHEAAMHNAAAQRPERSPRESLRETVLRGLFASPKTLPPKLFYDATGARLFEEICTLDEYYLTRTEFEILAARRAEIAALAGPRCALIEYGSGAGRKVRLLLDALDAPAIYLPVDISREQLARVAADLAVDYPSVSIQPICADYTSRFRLPPIQGEGRRVAFFPGSTIGNFHPAEATAFLQRIRHVVGPSGRLVLGVDRAKESETLHAAYNDARGVTAAFNLNLLVRMNRELGADFDLGRFRHCAFYNEEAGRIEMHLESRAAQMVCVGGEVVTFAEGETIWTESSYKYDEERLRALVGPAGFEIDRLWTDPHDRFFVAALG
jgi:L-histidine N-alpha-methyltransferase